MTVNVLLSGKLRLDGYGQGHTRSEDGTFRLSLGQGSTVRDVIQGMGVPKESPRGKHGPTRDADGALPCPLIVGVGEGHSTAHQPVEVGCEDFVAPQGTNGGEGVIDCATCHPVNFVQFTCDPCHEPAEMVEEHNDEDIFDIAGRCLECHPNGLKEERDD